LIGLCEATFRVDNNWVFLRRRVASVYVASLAANSVFARKESSHLLLAPTGVATNEDGTSDARRARRNGFGLVPERKLHGNG
jgi:hypothetical protein